MSFTFQTKHRKKKKQYNNLLKNEIEVQQIFKQINTLPLIPIEYVEPVFTTIENENRFNELNSFFNYFRETYIKRFNPELWNYYNIINHRKIMFVKDIIIESMVFFLKNQYYGN